MLRGTYRCGALAWCAVRVMVRAALVAIGGGLPMAGCMTPELPAISMPALGGPASNASGSHGTVAFESIDGPPEPLFRKLVTQLAQEANARQVAMVSRDSPAQYRIRGYVAAHVQGTKTTLSWVWDVYDADRERAVRFAGEVPGAPSERAWAAADDQVVTRIAREGMNRLAAFLAAPPRDEHAPHVASASGNEAALAFLPPRP